MLKSGMKIIKQYVIKLYCIYRKQSYYLHSSSVPHFSQNTRLLDYASSFCYHDSEAQATSNLLVADYHVYNYLPHISWTFVNSTLVERHRHFAQNGSVLCDKRQQYRQEATGFYLKCAIRFIVAVRTLSVTVSLSVDDFSR